MHLRKNIDTTYSEYDENNNLISEEYCANKFYDCEIKYFYDKNGSKLYQEKYFPRDLGYNQYDFNLRYHRERYSDSSFLRRVITLYDEFGRKKEEIKFINLGYLLRKDSYNEFDRVNHILVFNDNGEVSYNMIYNYDENGNPLDWIHYNQNGEIKWSKITIWSRYQ